MAVPVSVRNCMFHGRSTKRFLVVGEGFVFALKIYSFFSRTTSTAVSDTIMSRFVCYSSTGKYSQEKPRKILLNFKKKLQNFRAGKSLFKSWKEL